MQLFYNLSDPGMEDMLYEIESVRRFARLRLTGPLPDETTILNFRHLLERHGLGRGLFEEINAHLAERGYRVRAGTVDASIIAAPSSTKNREGARDPEMHQTRKGNEWHFGMKAHIGVDAETGLVHGVRATPANTHDLREAGALLHGGEEEVWADAGYRGIEKWVDTGGRPVQWHVAMRPWLRERDKASVRAKVEHPFLYVKRRFGYRRFATAGWPRTWNGAGVPRRGFGHVCRFEGLTVEFETVGGEVGEAEIIYVEQGWIKELGIAIRDTFNLRSLGPNRTEVVLEIHWPASDDLPEGVKANILDSIGEEVRLLKHFCEIS